MSGANLKQEQDILDFDTSDIQKIEADSKDGIHGETNGHKSARGDSLEKTDNPRSIQEVEESLGKLKLDNNNGTDNGQSEQLDLKFEEIDLSNLREGPPIVLMAGDGCEIRPEDGNCFIYGEYLLPAEINKWAIVILFDRHIVSEVEMGFSLHDELRRFASRYTKFGRWKGVPVSHVDAIHCVPRKPSLGNTVVTMSKEELKSELHQLMAKLNINLIDHAIIILPEDCPLWVHGYLQYLETIEWGPVKRPGLKLLTRTSRMQYATLKKRCLRRGKYGLNPHIWFKYNNKFNGVSVALKQTVDTQELRFLNDGFLILGIDLRKLDATTTEGAEPALRGVDIVGAVGMWDLTSDQMSFRTQTRVQRHNIAVVEIDLLVRDVILSYKKRKGGKLPAHIIIFRTLTQEHEVSKVAQQELSSIKTMLAAECGRLRDGSPTLTYLRFPRKKRISDLGPRHEDLIGSFIQTGSLVDSIMSEGKVAPSVSASHPNESKNQPEQPLKTWKLLKVYDEIDLSPSSIRAMINALSYLSPKTTNRTRPAPIDLADSATDKTKRISVGWLEDKGDRYKDDQDGLIRDLNHFLTEEMGDESYRNSLYHA